MRGTKATDMHVNREATVLRGSNTFQDHKEAQLNAQNERLMQTPKGRTALRQLCYTKQTR